MSSRDIGPLIASGRVADVHAWGDAVAKLYKTGGMADAFAEAAILAVVAAHGLPAPQVLEAGQYDGRWGLAMTRAPGEPLGAQAQADPALIPAALDEMVRLQLMLHAVTETRLRPLKSRLADRISAAAQLDDALRQKLLAGLVALPDGQSICHGDFHPFNLIGRPGETVIVDWLDATSGPPAADACRSYLLLQVVPGLSEAYLDRYVARSGALRAKILAWLPYVAAARLVEGVVEEEENLLRLARSVGG